MKALKYIISLFLVASMVACKTQKETTTKPGASARAEVSDPRMAERVTAMFIDASREKVLGNFRQAMNLYRQCLSLNPDHAPSMYEMARIYRLQGSLNDALPLAERAVEIDPENKWYKLLLGSLYEQSGQLAKSVGILNQLLVHYPSDIEFMHQIALLYLKQNKFGEAISMYDKIERITGPEEDIIIQKHQLYLLNDQPEKAIKEIEKLINMYPAESRYYALLAELYLDLDNFPKAIENLEKISELDPDNPYIHTTLAEYYFKTGDRARAFQELKSGFANPNLDLDIKFQVLFSFYTDEEISGEYKHEVTELTDILLKTHPNDARPWSMKADLLIREEKYEEARDVFKKIISIDNSRFFVWETLIRLNAMLRDEEAMLEESLQAIELFPLQPFPYLFAGLAHHQLENYQEAVNVLNRGKDLVVDDDEMLVEFYMYLGDTYHKLNQHEASDASYEQALAMDPDNPYALNNYSYYLSLRKERLDEAEKMSARSLELSPENKHYLDTYGWIMYQMGKYEEAKYWIEQSIENNASEDAVVLEHLGDVLYKLGKKEEALIYWKQALELGGDITEFLEKKVKDRTLYE